MEVLEEVKVVFEEVMKNMSEVMKEVVMEFLE